MPGSIAGRRPTRRPAVACGIIVACAAVAIPAARHPAHAVPLGANPEQTCTSLAGAVPAAAIGVKSGPAVIESAAIVPATSFAVAERAPSPAARITPATPSFCKVLGHIKPIDPSAPNIAFQ